MNASAAAMASPIMRTYLARTRSSVEAHRRARKVLPGGNTRQTAFWKPYPISIERANGHELLDVDGNRYIDLNNNYTALVHGHAYPPIIRAVREQVERGSCWAAGAASQATLARQIVDRVASVDQVRFTNSGTEAANLAFSMARAITGRNKALMARHGYHGSLVGFESGRTNQPWPMTCFAEYNDAEGFERILRDRGGEIAAVFLEPVMGAGGIIPAEPGFLEAVMRSANAAGAVFVLDEVQSFRLATGGYQARLDTAPDLTMFGKFIGGGYPVGAVGGRADLMKVLEPETGQVHHGGTFNGNPVTMAAGAVSLEELTAARIDRMAVHAERLGNAILSAAGELDLPVTLTRAGSLMNLHFGGRPRAPLARRESGRLMSLFHLAALNRGLFLAPRCLIVLSTVMTEVDISEVAYRMRVAMQDVTDELQGSVQG